MSKGGRPEPIRAKKSLGQHFLQDLSVLRAIARECGSNAPPDFIVEIGPGTGNLTRVLLEKYTDIPVLAVEKDFRSVAHLRSTIEAPNFEVLSGDATSFNFSALPDGRGTIVGNLPYNVGTAIYTRSLTQSEKFHTLVFMFQAEVARRITAVAGSKAYGSLSVFANLWGDNTIVLEVPPNAFLPPPKVDSAVVRSIPSRRPRFPLEGPAEDFERFVQAAFRYRRKMLPKGLSLSGWNQDVIRSTLESLNISGTIRPEKMSPANLVALWNAIHRESA